MSGGVVSVTASSIPAADCLSGRLQAMSKDIPHVDDFTVREGG